MKKRKKILVVLGGTSKERKVSIATGKACSKALKSMGYIVNEFDPQKKNFNLIDKKKVDIIFNALHGKDGEDGVAQSFFEYLRIPYTHSGVVSSMNAMDKAISKEIFIKNKILNPKYIVIKKNRLKKINIIKNIKKKKITFPIVIKPVNEGSSIGVKIVKNAKELKIKINFLFSKYDHLIIEQFIGGQEIQVAVMANKSLGAIELRPKRKFYDYKAKYLKSAKTDHVMPAEISKKKYKEVNKIAEKTHKALNCKGITRSDFKFYKNKFFILEINTQPGMTDLSLVPEIAKYNDISFKDLVKKMINDASLNR